MDRKSTFATISLAVAGLAVLASFGFWFVNRDFSLPVQISLALVVIGFALFVYFDPDRARSLFTGRQARYGSNAFVLFIAFFGILVVINFLVYKNYQDWGLRWDLTEDQERTLAPETILTLQSLEQPIVVRAYYTEGSAVRETARQMLDDFKFYGKGNFLYEIIDPDAEPVGARPNGTIVFSLGDTEETVNSVTELQFTSAILRLLTPGDKGIYFLTGHGEYTIDSSGDKSLSTFSSTLTDHNYQPASLNLLAEPTIPDDALAVVIAGPLQPITQAEMDVIADYVAGGGSLIVAEEPTLVTDFGNNPDPVADYLKNTWGIVLGNDLVVDLQANQAFNSPFIAISASYGTNPITTDLLQRQLFTIFPLARSVTPSPEPVDGVTLVELVSTSDQAWAETNFDSINDGSLQPDDADIVGVVTVAMSGTNAATGGRVVVFGDVDFMGNDTISQYGNSDLAVNAVDWAAQQEDLITLTPKDVTQRLIVPPQGSTINLLALGTVIVIPGLVLLAGIVVWIGRRRRA